MLKIDFIGTIGADAEFKEHEGSKFTTFRAAHNESWRDAAGREHTSTIWVDCVMNDHPKVGEYLKQGTQIYCYGYPTLRVYSSPKDKCMKAGLTIRIQHIELLGGRVDNVPRQLIDAESGSIYDVQKWFLVQGCKSPILVDKRGNRFSVNPDGWVLPFNNDSVGQYVESEATGTQVQSQAKDNGGLANESKGK